MGEDRLSRRGALLALGAAGAVALAACAPDRPARTGDATQTAAPIVDATPSPTPTPTPTDTPTPTPMPTPTPDAAAPATDTTMSIWAHCDDDLIFMGTHLQAAVEQGHAICTVYVTAGDAGRGLAHGTRRERGITRAYDRMRGRSGTWDTTTEVLASGMSLTTRRATDDPRFTLHFLRLPDGNTEGQGFAGDGHASLQALMSGKLASVAQLGTGAAVTWSQLGASLEELVARYRPVQLFTHVPAWSRRFARHDHSDHAVTGVVAYRAWKVARPQSQMLLAQGYGIADLPPNVPTAALERKLAVFRAYTPEDPHVSTCVSDASCLALPHFGQWLQREYPLTPEQVAGG